MVLWCVVCMNGQVRSRASAWTYCGNVNRCGVMCACAIDIMDRSEHSTFAQLQGSTVTAVYTLYIYNIIVCSINY